MSFKRVEFYFFAKKHTKLLFISLSITNNMDREFTSQLNQFKKECEVFVETVHIQPLQEKLIKIIVNKIDNDDCRLDFWYYGELLFVIYTTKLYFNRLFIKLM